MHSVPAAKEAFDAGDYEEGTRQLIHAAEQGGMLAGVARIKGRMPTKPSTSPTLSSRMAGLGGEEGLISLEIYDRFGNQIGTRNFQGSEVMPGGHVGEVPPGAKVKMVMYTPPRGLEATKAMEWAYNRVPSSNIEFIDATGGSRLPITQDAFVRAVHEASVPKPTPPLAARPSTLRQKPSMEQVGALPRTRSGRISTVTDPFKLQKMQQQSQTYIDLEQPTTPAAPKTIPEPTTTPISYEQHMANQQAQRAAALPPEQPSPAAPQEPPSSSYMERALAAIMEQNTLMRQYIEALLSNKSAPTGAAAPATPTGPSLPTAGKPAAPPPPTPPATPPAASAVEAPGTLEADVMAAIKEAPKVELTAAEKGYAPSTKKGSTSYVGKTLEEKYASTDPAASSTAVTPRTLDELRTAVAEFEAGRGKPVNVVRRGLGDAPPTKGTLLYNILVNNKPSDRYAFMPDNWSGNPFDVKISDLIVRPEGKSQVMTIPRFSQRTFDLGFEVAVPRKAQITKGTRVRLPDGSLGTHVENVTSGKKAIEYFLKNLKKAAKDGDPEAQTKYQLFKSKIESKGYTELARVKLDDGRWIDFIPEELTPVEELAPSKTKPSTKISKQTKLERKEVEKRMKSAGPTAGTKPLPIEEKGISGEAIAKAKGLDRPLDELTKKRIREKLIATAKSNPRKPLFQGEEPIKPTPPPAATPAKAVSAPEPADTHTRILNKYKKDLEPLEAQEAKQGFRLRQADELRAKIKKLEEVAPKSEAKLTEPPLTKGYTAPTPDFSKMTPSQIRAWGEKQVNVAKLKGRSERRAMRRYINAAVYSESQRNILRTYLEQLKDIEKIEATIGGPTKAGDALRKQILDLEKGITPIPPPPK
jgi:hypothetical protein